MDNKKVDNLIAKHFSGEATTKEKSELRLWLNSSKQNREEFNKIALTYQLSRSNSDPARKTAVLDRINDKISSEHKFYPQRSRPQLYWWGAAASVLFFFTLSLFFYSSGDRVSQIIPQRETVDKSNPPGQKSKIFLPDGSIAWLNSGSSLSYEAEFNDTTRLIEMEGEAYFEVKKDASRPFIVKSKSIIITALGTAFNVNTFKGQQEVHVALTEGVISIENSMIDSANKIVIHQGEGVVFDPLSSAKLEKVEIDIEDVKQWKNGVLVMKNTSFEETIGLLSRWYDVKFHVNNNPVREWSATGVFDNEYLENVMNTLSFSQGFEYVIDSKNIYITFIKTDAYDMTKTN